MAKKTNISKGGIYKITNLINKKIYIGSSCYIKRRWSEHKSDLNNNSHCNKHLQRAWNKYGEESFSFEIICHTLHNSHLLAVEQFYLDILTPQYNNLLIAGSPLGMKRPSEAIEATRLKNLGRKRSELTKKKIGESKKGNTYSLGRSHSLESRQKMSTSRIGNTNGTGNRGKKQSSETVTKRIEAMKLTKQLKKKSNEDK